MTERLPLHRGLELAANYREGLVSRGILNSVTDPLTDRAFSEVLRNEGILLACVTLSEKVSAVYMRSGPCALVLVNRMNTVGHQRFSLAHELCHHLHHKDLNTWICDVSALTEDRREKEANEFAAALLLPAQGVGQVFSAQLRDDLDLERAALQVCVHYGCSWQTCLNRLHKLGLLSSMQRDDMAQRKVMALAKKHDVPSDVFDARTSARIPPEFAEVAKDLLRRSVISDQKFESLMDSLRALAECGGNRPEVSG